MSAGKSVSRLAEEYKKEGKASEKKLKEEVTAAGACLDSVSTRLS